MPKIQPVGLGVWVAFPGMIKGGYEALIEEAADLGIQWIAPRGGQRGRGDLPRAKHEKLAKLASDHNVGWFPWLYNCPDAISKEVEVYGQFMEEGASGIILDAEDPYKVARWPDNRGAARQLGKQLREKLPEAFIAHAPYSYVYYHQDFPYVELGEFCDAVMDQLYWTEFNRSGPGPHMAATDAQWARFRGEHPNSAKLRCPIGVTYGNGLPGVAQQPPGEFKVEDMLAFLARYDDDASNGGQALPFWSLYSYEVARPGVKEALRALREAREEAVEWKKEPGLILGDETASLPLGWATEVAWSTTHDERNQLVSERYYNSNENLCIDPCYSAEEAQAGRSWRCPE